MSLSDCRNCGVWRLGQKGQALGFSQPNTADGKALGLSDILCVDDEGSLFFWWFGAVQGSFEQPDKVFTMDTHGLRLVVGTAGRHVYIYDLRNMHEPLQKRESSLKFQTRAIRCFPNGDGEQSSFFSFFVFSFLLATSWAQY